MGDFHFGGTEEESAEITKFNNEVVSRSSTLEAVRCRS
jgi:hypothetical protein